MSRKVEPTGTPGPRDGEASSPVAESDRTFVVPRIARRPAPVGPTTPRSIRTTAAAVGLLDTAREGVTSAGRFVIVR